MILEFWNNVIIHSNFGLIRIGINSVKAEWLKGELSELMEGLEAESVSGKAPRCLVGPSAAGLRHDGAQKA